MNKVQSIVAQLMEASSFNDFDGKAVVKKLEENEELWKGFVWGRFDGYSELITLRDIGSECYNADTLYILPTPGKEDALKKLAKTFSADEVDWVEGKEAGHLLGSYGPSTNSAKKVILRVWWD